MNFYAIERKIVVSHLDRSIAKIKIDNIECVVRRKQSRLLIIEPNKLIGLEPIFTLNEFRVIQMAISKLHILNDIHEIDINQLTLMDFIEIDIEEYCHTFGIDYSGGYKAITEAAQTLQDITIRVDNNIYDKERSSPSKGIRSFCFVKTIYYNPYEMVVKIKLHEDFLYMLSILGEGMGYSKYLIENTSKMRNINSINFYRYLNKIIRERNKKKVDYEVEVDKIRVITGTKDKYSSFAELKRNVIDKIISDVNAYSDIEVSINRMVRKGRVITGLELEIKFKKES